MPSFRKGFQKDKDRMPSSPEKSKKILENPKSTRKRINMKPRAGDSFSIYKRRRFSTKTMTRQHHSLEKNRREDTTYETEASSSTSTTSNLDDDDSETESSTEKMRSAESNLDEDEWETESSIEKMRSADLMSVDESVIPPPESFRDDLASLVFLENNVRPIFYSTPRILSNVNTDALKVAVPYVSPTKRSDVVKRSEELPTIPNVSSGDEFAKESDTLEDENFQLKSISPEQNLELPDIPDDVIKESQEQSEDSIVCSQVPPSGGSNISEDSDVSTVPNFVEDRVYRKNNPFETAVANKSTNSNSRKRKQEEKVGNTFKDIDDGDVSTEPNFEEDQEYCKKNPFEAAVVNKSNSNYRKRKQEDKVRNVFEDMDDYSNGEDESTVPNSGEDDQEYRNHNPFKAAVANKSTNSNSRKQKREDNVRNSFKDVDDYSNGEIRETRNIQIDSFKKKGKGYKVNNRINDSITRWKQKNERINLLEYKSDGEDNFENVKKIQTKELLDNELVNNQPQIISPQIKNEVKVFVGLDSKSQQDKGTRILNRSQRSTSLRRKHRYKKRNLSENLEKSDIDDNFENVSNPQNEDLQDYKLDHNQKVTATHQKKTNRIKFASISRSTNSNPKKKYRNRAGNSSVNVDSYNRGDNFEENETPKRKGTLYRSIKLKYNKRIKTPHIKKLRKKGGNLLEDIDKNDSEDSFETVQNDPKELQDNELDNNQTETGAHQINRKINKRVGVDSITQQDVNITNRSQSSISLRKKHKNGCENLSEDIDKNDTEDSWENFQNVQLQDDELDNNIPETSAHNIRRKINIDVGVDDMTQQNCNVTNRSQNSTYLRRKHTNERKNVFRDLDKRDNAKSFENIQQNKNDCDKVRISSEDNYNREDNFEEAQIMEINTSKKKRTPYRSVGIKRHRHVNRSRKSANSLNKSKNSTGREVSVGLQNNRIEAEKTNWPRCCIEASFQYEQTFRILKPTFRDDYPIDSLTMLNYGIESKKKCKH